MNNSRVKWYQSVAVKSCLIAFVATHIPLLGLIALIVLRPGELSPWGVFLVALVFTLVATGVVIAVLWHMFRPLRAAADGINGFMARGEAFHSSTASRDEVGRLVQVLVRSLAHLDRSRTPLLYAGAYTVGKKVKGRAEASADKRWMALVEIDQWEPLDMRGAFGSLQVVQQAVHRVLSDSLQDGEVVLPWGRGRFLVVLMSAGADAHERLEKLCDGIDVVKALAGNLPKTDLTTMDLPDQGMVTLTVALEPQAPQAEHWPAALQRLEHKLFSMRMDGRTGQVA